MRRYFNTEGRCRQDIHYMVRLEQRLEKIKREYIDFGKYFVMNRGRQYGKTTTLMALAEYLKEDYIVLAMDFRMMSTANFADEQTFVISFIEYLEDLLFDQEEIKENIEPEAYQNLLSLMDKERVSLDKMFRGLSRICKSAKKPIIMLIDEVDSASNCQVFLDFLSLLRGYYLNREHKPIFHSVILAGVYDIKNLKLKLRPDEEHQYNSPWNIAADFDIDMDFSVEQIAGMLGEYEKDYQIGMNVEAVAKEIYQYTSGYPYLVSAICKIIDEKLPQSGNRWDREGVTEAVKIIMKWKTPLFESMVKQLDTYPDMRDMIEEILYHGSKIPFSLDVKSINIGVMFGFLKGKEDYVTIANRIFEMRMLNMFITEEAMKSNAFHWGQRDKNLFIQNGRLDMKRILEKFVIHFTDIYGQNGDKFVEEYGRKFFLLYLKPIINGTGNYYIEAQTRDARRTDVVVDYLGEQFIVELKIWRGSEYNERGEHQLVAYLEYFHQDKGYLLSFNFNQKKEQGVKELRIDNKIIIEAVV